MRAVKAKAIRRAMRANLEQGSAYAWIAHPKTYTNVRGENMLRYTFQYVIQGGVRLVKLGKKIYNAAGVLPKKVA